jgi:hypothetical protein
MRKTVMLTDGERACQFMFENMKQAEQNGDPLTNHLILQQRAAQN